MNRTLSRWLGLAAAGLLAFALAPAHSQAPAGNTGKIHGRVINPTGQPQGGGTVSLSTDGGVTLKYTFPVDESGNYTGEAPQGTYMVVYRAADTPAGKMVDSIRGIKIVIGQDIAQDVDMSRQEYIDKMSPEEKKQLEDLKKANAAALQANVLINQLNADLKVVNQDKKDIDNSATLAAQALGGTPSKADLASKVIEIKTAKYTDIVSIATRDTGLKPDEALLWSQLGYGQAGLKHYDDAITSYKKAIDLETASKKPRMPVIGQAQSGLGECYARTGKIPEANAAFDAAAKADPANAQLYLKNQAIIFFQEGNATAQAAAADDAIKSDPNPNDPGLAILYYIKGQGLIMSATVDAKGHYVLPPECMAAYKKYLELAPKGQFAADVAGILAQAAK
ncbi:MAG: carboxypeptidase-like regulatory domain-containing protein [Terracidiphilus sp.]|nr:carboxypeptidase-like regulatory domain-containing protein [Terracidiphilus sp.]MDR3797108.1 carboxypeptidase-like regulatory domain-containing protein [Terracidiphilus sp.]